MGVQAMGTLLVATEFLIELMASTLRRVSVIGIGAGAIWTGTVGDVREGGFGPLVGKDQLPKATRRPSVII